MTQSITNYLQRSEDSLAEAELIRVERQQITILDPDGLRRQIYR